MLSCLEILSTTSYDNVSSGEMVIGVTASALLRDEAAMYQVGPAAVGVLPRGQRPEQAAKVSICEISWTRTRETMRSGPVGSNDHSDDELRLCVHLKQVEIASAPAFE
ncbi:hypothetical protein KC326_g133 [Hortaea werneckii]|nr:hypothetical protein KC326_g133 [Hortaea werneckii]